jgi:hypothetical protein
MIIVFNGSIQIEKAGIYTFYSSANNGSWLYINNKLLVDNSSGIESGDISLGKGKYPLIIIYFENTGTESLDVFMKGPESEKGTILPGLLFFK